MPYVPVDAYVLNVLLRDLVGHDQKPSAFLVYLCLWSRAAEGPGRTVRISHRMLADATGLSKSAVQAGVKHLVRRRLLRVQRRSRTATPEYTLNRPWVRRR